MPTAKFNLPLYTTSDTAALDTLLNGQSNALETALLASSVQNVADATARGTFYPAPANGNKVYNLATRSIEIHNGTTWLALDLNVQTFTPTFNSVTLGNGTSGGYYQRKGQTVEGFAWFKMGSTTSFSGTVTMALPLTAVVATTPNVHEVAGVGSINRPGVFFAPFHAVVSSTTTMDLLIYNAGGTWASYGNVNATQPGAFGTDAVVSVRFSYRIA